MAKQEQLRVVWEDFEHAYVWSSAFDGLRERGINLTVINGYTERGISSEREYQLSSTNANVFVVHSGSVNPPDMRELIKDIRSKYDGIRILLQTEAVNELTMPHIDGVVSVYMMNELDELVDVLSGNAYLINE